MTTVVINSDTDDTYLYKNGSNYNTVWTSPTGFSQINLYLPIGQCYIPGVDYDVYRSFLYFDTSILTDDALITSAKISLYGLLDNSSTDFDIVVQNGQPDYPNKPASLSDYNKEVYAGNYGSMSSSDFKTEDYNDISLTTSIINKTGTTKVCLRSSRDISGNAPAFLVGENVQFYEYGTANKEPKLTVIYTIPDYKKLHITSSNENIYNIESKNENQFNIQKREK